MWDIVAFYESAARNGLAGIAAVADQLYETGGDNLYARENSNVAFAELITAAIANTDQWRFRKPTDATYHHMLERTGIRDQTDNPILERILQNLGYPLNKNDPLNVDADNTNNAQVECALFGIGIGNARPRLVPMYLLPFTKPIKIVQVTGTATLTAGAWTTVTATWPTLEPNKNYTIVGLAASSATCYAARVIHRVGQWQQARPGVPGYDVADMAPLIGCDLTFGTFPGKTPPNFEFLASAGDTAENINVALLEG